MKRFLAIALLCALASSAHAQQPSAYLMAPPAGVSSAVINGHFYSGSAMNPAVVASQTDASALASQGWTQISSVTLSGNLGTPSNPLTAASPLPAAVAPAQIKIVTTGTAVCFPAQALQNGALVKAKSSNVGNGFVGGAGVTAVDDGTGNGYRLLPGEAVSGSAANASAFCVNGTANDVYYMFGN